MFCYKCKFFISSIFKKIVFLLWLKKNAHRAEKALVILTFLDSDQVKRDRPSYLTYEKEMVTWKDLPILNKRKKCYLEKTFQVVKKVTMLDAVWI